MRSRIHDATARLPRLALIAVCSWVVFGICIILLSVDTSRSSLIMSTLFSPAGRTAIVGLALTLYGATATLTMPGEPLPAPVTLRTLTAALLASVAVTVAAFAAWIWGISDDGTWKNHAAHTGAVAAHALASALIAAWLAKTAAPAGTGGTRLGLP